MSGSMCRGFEAPTPVTCWTTVGPGIGGLERSNASEIVANWINQGGRGIDTARGPSIYTARFRCETSIAPVLRRRELDPKSSCLGILAQALIYQDQQVVPEESVQPT